MLAGVRAVDPPCRPPGWAPGWQGPPRRQGAEGGGEETRMGEGEAQEGEVGRDGCHRAWGAGPSLRGPGGPCRSGPGVQSRRLAVRRAPEQDGDLSTAPDALSQGPWQTSKFCSLGRRWREWLAPTSPSPCGPPVWPPGAPPADGRTDPRGWGWGGPAASACPALPAGSQRSVV